ncbi:AraC family transcriptional regulator [Neisseria iguanae]|uniref:AraC family transcriptional regulator n=1 Tax=Neisseria iguanae TaxID=90242 RepID=UPI001B80B882|nr:AraC family transcriptional regulator [Neisseria iguanae]
MLKIALLLYPEVNPFHFSVPYMAFQDAAEDGLFDVKIVTPTGKPLHNQIMQPPIDGSLDLMAQCDIVVVPGWKDEQTQPVPELVTALQSACLRGAYIVGLCYGAYALAYAGLLDGKKAATHWKGEADFSRRFPEVKLDVNSIYVEDGNIITSAGTAAALDCCLHIIRASIMVRKPPIKLRVCWWYRRIVRVGRRSLLSGRWRNRPKTRKSIRY